MKWSQFEISYSGHSSIVSEDGRVQGVLFFILHSFGCIASIYTLDKLDRTDVTLKNEEISVSCYGGSSAQLVLDHHHKTNTRDAFLCALLVSLFLFW